MAKPDSLHNNGLPIPGSDGVVAALGDFNGDGVLDVAFGTAFQDLGNVTVAYGRGDGTFYIQSVMNGTQTLGTSASTTGMVVADFNGDGLADIVVMLEGTLHILLYTNDGKGGFQTSYIAAGTSPRAIVSADFKKESKTDLAILGFQPAVPPCDAVILFSQ